MRICGDNADVLYAVKVWLTGISNGKLVTINLLAASDAFISRFISNNSGYAYAGNDISEIDKIVSHDEMNIAEGTFSINGAFYELNSISSSEYFAIVNTGYGTTAEAISLSESIILRLDTKTYETVLSSDTGSMQYMFIHFREGVDNNSKNMVLSSISRYFTQKSGYSYTINDYYSGYRKNISDVSQNVKLISFIASVTLLITGAGLCGTLILIVERRIKGYAVEYAMGVNKTTLNCMVFFETMTVLLLALVSALPISLLSAPLMSTGFYTVRLHTEAIVICSLGSGFIALLSALLSMHSVSSSKLAGVLRIQGT